MLGTSLAYQGSTEVTGMSLVRLLGFTTLTCGCVTGRYREVGSDREITYIEEKGTLCATSSHVRNQPVSADRVAHGFTPAVAVRA
ncbi:MAG: hypothetical protein AB7L71_14400 [Vicinamibacterales bacterium]|jgi:hypothetical protein